MLKIMNKTKLLIMFFVGLLLVGSVNAADKYVSVTGAGSHNGQLGNEWTLQEAVANAVAGDTVHVAVGFYNLTAALNFNKDGTASNPITWTGVISDYDLGVSSSSADGSQSTVLRSTFINNGAINMNGDYNIFKNMVFQQDTVGKVLMYVSGNYVTLDSTASKYPSNVGSSSNHLILVYGTHVTFKYSSFYNGPRTIIWVRKNSGTQGDYFTMEYCTLKGASNHAPIQIMPDTGLTNSPLIQGTILRNNYFVDNPYAHSIYLRHTQNFKIYNNLFVNSGGRYGTPVNVQTHSAEPFDTYNANGLIAYNTYVADGYSTPQEFIHHFGNMNNVSMYNNLAVFSSVSTVYRSGCVNNTVSAGLNWKSDYNMFYAENDPTWTSSKNSEWNNDASCGRTTYSWAQTKSVLGFDVHSVVGVLPQFVNAEARDYHLKSTSRGIGEGIPLASLGITTDKDGNPRDPIHPTIGAYEYVDGAALSIVFHPADTSQNGCIDLGEISEYVNLWLSNQGVTLESVSGAVNLWIGGC
jgi:hypothetical protein